LLIALLPDRPKHDNLHLLERIDLNFRLQISIVADALNLTRFKVAGVLPTLAVNVSNSKYNGLMRIINASIPDFEREAEEEEVTPSKMPPNRPEGRQRQPSNLGAMRLPSNPFVNSLQEYTIEEEPQEKEQDCHPNRGEICKRNSRKQNRRHSNSRLKLGRYKRHSLRRMLPA